MQQPGVCADSVREHAAHPPDRSGSELRQDAQDLEQFIFWIGSPQKSSMVPAIPEAVLVSMVHAAAPGVLATILMSEAHAPAKGQVNIQTLCCYRRL